ncbi:hypothetical protein F2Q68_00010148 [Brassica cretica]|uniref:Mitochondrial carrier protein n=1 Tax=Brassica cretica TaxID=69181 RepID=A0A8S9KRR6_BRACR|nr:hypothetical protein F2Q68_00010148 [Brassica cretica]
MQLDTQKHEVSQYLRSAHANRHAEARVSRCMNTRHAEGQVDVEVSYGMARRHATGHVDAHVSPRMRPEACETTHMRSGGIVYLVLVLLCENLVVVLVLVCRSLLPQMPPASPIEDRGTAIPIEDRDRAILERLRLCGVTSRKDHSARGTVGAGVDWTSFAKDSFSRYINVCVSGLYRGIASNIASSAPISALYTFTYESVKGALLPVFPKEYCSLAHCVAGGSASVATSFIFTPSERIKQQMQVSSHYRNCWTALVGIIQKGGLLSLYAGWSAVLCRNIPHSIIKFYVYENMKRMVLPSIGPCGQAAQPTTLQTLVCGGLAGSAAAFFTTPFDVVKTRLQTQIPGSKTQHPSVYQALQSIRKREGPRGLYRGLIPRLVMYMSQGAIFFASYEFYKSILSLEDLSARWHKTKDGDNPNPL